MNYFLKKKKILNFWKIFDVLKEIQSSWNNHNDIGLKIEDTQKLCNKYMLHKYELMVWHKIIWMLLTQEYGNIYIYIYRTNHEQWVNFTANRREHWNYKWLRA